ncbi:hybrid sensor histidine kinase/response regulator [Cupriavidus sp. AU9028]|uniref:hybrid sensor histidine kinase/response regulator n=1 Tax=Cupriavidus sp. AU9028 TaxID=2871157 RepID=UPI001C98ABAD|nr:hybrid sensor histidine kinase/response regulator [Cupriavidus sp. AU9028]MBY4897349.1 hybrid sensor histidine kinase/response regulator [Cupriavidus sp. AU9028]
MNDFAQPRLIVLYVDDEEMACKYFARAAGLEYEVLTATSAQAAIEVLQQHPSVAVLVTDFRMPGRNGADLLRQVAADYPQIVRILVTAYADKDMLLQTVNTGEVFRILEKPLGLQAVRDVLALARERHRERMSRHQRMTAIDETLAFLAHELNTPLAAIANFARGIESRSAAEYSPQRQIEIGHAAAVTQSNAQYCLAVISSFLQSVRGNGDRPLASGGEHDATAAGLIMALLDTYPFTGNQRNCVEVELHGDFTVHSLPNCVSLVLSSLLSNALRALADIRVPSLRFRVVAQPDPVISISDNGPGIPRDVMQRLLVDPVTTHAAAGGNGLGMIFCNRVMQSFGGSVRIESVSGGGTTVTLVFPKTPNQAKNNRSGP